MIYSELEFVMDECEEALFVSILYSLYFFNLYILLSIQVNEGNVGIYYRHGALKDRVTDPGVRIIPFLARKLLNEGERNHFLEV